MDQTVPDRLSSFESVLYALNLFLELAPVGICTLLFAIACLRLDRSGQTFTIAISRATDACVSQVKAQPLLALSCLTFWGVSKALFNYADTWADGELVMMGLSCVGFLFYIVVLSVFNIALVQRLARADGIDLPPLKVMATTAVQLMSFNIILGVAGTMGAILILPALWLFARTALVPPLLVLSQGGLCSATRESWRSTAGHFWLIAYLLLPVLIVQLLPGFVVDAFALVVPASALPAWSDAAVRAGDLLFTPLECVLDFLYIGLSYQLYRRLKN